MSKATNDDFEVPTLSEHPTPDERSNYVIMRLEQFIREGRTLDEGMSFKKWQAMARTEITIAIAEAENSQDHDEINSRRILFVAAFLVDTGILNEYTVYIEHIQYNKKHPKGPRK